MTINTKPKGFLPTGKNPGKNDVQAVLDEFALEMREGNWKTLKLGWEDVYAVEIPQYLEILATLAFTRGKEQGKLELAKELLYAPVNTEELTKYLLRFLDKNERPAWFKSQIKEVRK